MEVTINGTKHQLSASLNISSLLSLLAIEGEAVIVEINEKIVKKDFWQTTFIKDDDVIELVSLVGGG